MGFPSYTSGNSFSSGGGRRVFDTGPQYVVNEKPSLADSNIGVTICTQSSDCGSGYACIQGRCEQIAGMNLTGDGACGNAADKQGSSTVGGCIDSECIKPNPNCEGGVVVCRPDEEGIVRCVCKEKCEGDSDCCVGGICVEGKCEEACSPLTEFDDCETGYSCEDGRCLPGDTITEPVCPQGMSLIGGECLGPCTTFCDSYQKTHGKRGPGCSESQECDACNDCSDNGNCVPKAENAPCWCVCPQDSLYCYDCSNDGSSELDCEGCESCSTIPEYVCDCGAVIEEVQVCRSACESPTRVTQQDVEDEATRQCAELCGVDTRCYGSCSDVVYEATVLPACPSGYLCSDVRRSGIGTDINVGLFKRLKSANQFAEEDGITNTEYASRITVSAVRLDNGIRETIRFNKMDHPRILSAWVGAINDITIGPSYRQTRSYTIGVTAGLSGSGSADQSVTTTSARVHGATDVWDLDCLQQWANDNPPCDVQDIDMPVQNFYHPNSAYASPNESLPNCMIDRGRTPDCFEREALVYEVRVLGRRFGKNFDDKEVLQNIGINLSSNGYTAKVPADEYDITSIELQQANTTPDADWENFEVRWDPAPTTEKITRKECLIEGTPPECLNAERNLPDTLHISFIDEDDGYLDSLRQDHWDQFLSQYPDRRLIMLMPTIKANASSIDPEAGKDYQFAEWPDAPDSTDTSLGTENMSNVGIPDNFQEFGRAFYVSRNGGTYWFDGGLVAQDPAERRAREQENYYQWMRDELNAFEGIKKVNVWVDNSGSMTTSDIQPNFDEFIQQMQSAGLEVFNLTELGADQGINYGEEWIKPHIDLEPISLLTEYCADPDSIITVITKGRVEGGTYELIEVVPDFAIGNEITVFKFECENKGTSFQVRVTGQVVTGFNDDGSPILGTSGHHYTDTFNTTEFSLPTVLTRKLNTETNLYESIEPSEEACTNFRTVVDDFQPGAPIRCQEDYKGLNYYEDGEDVWPALYQNLGANEDPTPPCRDRLENKVVVERLDGIYQVRFYLDGQMVNAQNFPIDDWQKTYLEIGNGKFKRAYQRARTFDYTANDQQELIRDMRKKGNSLIDVSHQLPNGTILMAGLPHTMWPGYRSSETFNPCQSRKRCVESFPLNGPYTPAPANEHYWDWWPTTEYGDYDSASVHLSYSTKGQCQIPSEMTNINMMYGGQMTYHLVNLGVQWDPSQQVADGLVNNVPCSTIDHLGNVAWVANCDGPPIFPIYELKANAVSN